MDYSFNFHKYSIFYHFFFSFWSLRSWKFFSTVQDPWFSIYEPKGGQCWWRLRVQGTACQVVAPTGGFGAVSLRDTQTSASLHLLPIFSSFSPEEYALTFWKEGDAVGTTPVPAFLEAMSRCLTPPFVAFALSPVLSMPPLHCAPELPQEGSPGSASQRRHSSINRGGGGLLTAHGGGEELSIQLLPSITPPRCLPSETPGTSNS